MGSTKKVRRFGRGSKTADAARWWESRRRWESVFWLQALPVSVVRVRGNQRMTGEMVCSVPCKHSTRTNMTDHILAWHMLFHLQLSRSATYGSRYSTVRSTSCFIHQTPAGILIIVLQLGMLLTITETTGINMTEAKRLHKGIFYQQSKY